MTAIEAICITVMVLAVLYLCHLWGKELEKWHREEREEQLRKEEYQRAINERLNQ